MSIDLIKNALHNTGGTHLGDLIFWSLGDARIDRKVLENVWAAAGLDHRLLPEPPTAEKALKLAVREAQVGQRECLIRLGKEDGNEIVFAVVRERRGVDGDLSYQQEARITLDRVRERFRSDAPAHELVAAVAEGFRALRSTHTPDDVRRAVVKALHSFGAVCLREGGGVYWVAAPFAESLRKLQTAVERIGHCRVYLLPVSTSPEAKATLGQLAEGSIESELADLRSEVQAFMHVPPERVSTLERRLEAFDGLRSRAQLYRSVLSVELADLDHQLDGLADVVNGMLDVKRAA